jgi:acid phosphatase family membrane protein YuiD
MPYPYLLTPFIAWLIAGSIKFLINSLIAKKAATDLIGYGGLPSNHSAIVCSMVTLIGLREGIEHPAFGVAVTLAFIVMIDASSLRKQIGKQAVALNRLAHIQAPGSSPLRERVGHSLIEIMAGVVVGVLVGSAINHFSA